MRRNIESRSDLLFFFTFICLRVNLIGFVSHILACNCVLPNKYEYSRRGFNKSSIMKKN